MKVIHPPKRRPRNYENELTIFFAGSIEQGKAYDWQANLIERLTHTVERRIDNHLVVFNPRRPDWDPTWDQSTDHPQFVEQVNWELDNIMDADLAVFVFDPDTMSPITLMELGLVLADPDGPTAIVLCPRGYWRKGNVDITVGRYAKTRSNVSTVEDMDEMVEAILGWAEMIEDEDFGN